MRSNCTGIARLSISPVALFVMLFPAAALALAGFAERTSVFHYNDFAVIELGHPSDICSGASKWCLALRRGNHEDFDGIDSTFAEINAPMGNSVPYLIGRRSRDEHWMVFDLEREQVLISASDHADVVGYWKALGLGEPVYVTPQNTSIHLIETKRSVRLRWTRDLQLWLVFALLPVAPAILLFWYLGRRANRRHHDTGSKGYSLAAHLFRASSLALVLLALHSLFRVIQQNW